MNQPQQHASEARTRPSSFVTLPHQSAAPQTTAKQETSAAADAMIEGATKLMSETAHDLRSPLTTIREAVRLVKEGSLGEVNDDQQELLHSAIDQCDCMNQMIGEMVQLERLRTGSPRAHRAWVSISEIRAAVDQTLQPWASPRNMDVLWDGGDDSSQKVFADASMIRRLIVNLVVNAIRASRQGQCILIRVASVHQSEAIQISVIDQGAGIAESDLRRISQHQVSMAGGEGLGLTICRQLAAVHFSSLKMRSRLGAGTEVNFELPASGPRSVAIAWTRWRLAMRGPRVRPTRRDASGEAVHSGSARKVRLDSPSSQIELNHQATKPRFEDRFAAGTVTIGATVSREDSDSFDQALQDQMRMFDLLYRIDARRWVWVFDADRQSAADRIDRIKQQTMAKSENSRSTWSDPQVIPVDDRRSALRLSDLLVRSSLVSSSNHSFLEQDEVRPGTEPLRHSHTATDRLDEELRRLSEQWKVQSKRLRHQAQQLRMDPPTA